MKYSQAFRTKLIPVGLALAAAATARADFNPIPLTPDSFNQDVVVEKTAPTPVVAGAYTTATMDSGAANTSYTFYEIGYNAAAPTTGLPAAGSTFTSQSLSDHQFKMAPSYTANNAVLIDSGVTSATLSFTTPAAYTKLSFLVSGGNTGATLNYVVHHQDNTTDTGSFSCPDWYNGANYAWIANGRVTSQGFSLDAVNGNNPRLYSKDITLTNTTSAVTSVDLTYSSGAGHDGIFAVSGSTGTAFSPIAVTGYNKDMIVEASAPVAAPIVGLTTSTMDDGTNNTGNTWYEQGWVPSAPATGLPAAGSTVTSLAAADHHYTMPASYVGNSAAFLDPTFTNVTLTLASPAAYSALSFLSSAGHGPVTNGVTINHADGTSETNYFISPDWFNNSPIAVNANGRVDVGSRKVNNVNNNNPRLYAAEFTLENTASPITNIVLTFVGAGPGGHSVIFAVSGTAGAVPPLLSLQPKSIRTYPGSNVVFSTYVSGTAPFYFQWQKGTNGEFVNLADGGNVSGAATTNLTLNNVTAADMADYRMIVTNVAGAVTSLVANLTVLSPLTDVTQPGDTILVYNGSQGGGTEGVSSAIDNTTSKYLNTGINHGAAPFIGPVGMVVTPWMGRTIVTALRFYTANDDAGRDPADYTLEGSNDGGASYEPISAGPLALPDARNGGGLELNPLTQNLQEVSFANTKGYTTYRLGFTNVKNSASALFQIGEVEFLGVQDTSGLPTVMVAPASITAYAGPASLANFSALISGAPLPTVQWYKNVNGSYVAVNDGGNISGATTSGLSFTGLNFSDAGNYVAVAANSSGSVTSSVVKLTVISPLPDVTAPGDTIGAFGTGWYFIGQEPDKAIDNATTIYSNIGHGENSDAQQPPFAGPVGLTITPSQGASLVTGLRIYTAPDHPERDPADFKLEGSSDGVSFSLIASGALALPDDRNPADTVLDPIAGLFFQEILFSNSTVCTTYRLTFTNVKNNNLANDLQIGDLELLGVTGAPTISITPGFVNFYPDLPGSTAQFNATVMGADAATTYQWMKRVNGVATPLVDNANVSGATTAALTLNNLSGSDAGDYVLVVSNSVAAATSQPVKLNALSHTPDVTSPADGVSLFNGTTPAGEVVAHALDNLTDKNLNFGTDGDQSAPFVGPVGLVVTPAAGRCIVTGLRVYTANDAPERDPVDFKLEGSLDGGATYSLIASGALSLPYDRNAGGAALDPLAQANQEVAMANSQAFSTYRLSFTHVRDDSAANSLQVAEVELLGQTLPTVSITAGAGGTLTISASVAGTLQSTTALNGANTVWVDEGPISGTVTITPSAGVPAKFYRLVTQ